MILFVNGGTKTVYAMNETAHLGILYSPACWNSIERAIEARLPWAMDNGAYSGFDQSEYRAMIGRCLLHRREGLQWIACPDVVGNHAATMELFDEWGMYLHRRGLPIAFVAQDGCNVKDVPWDYIKCLFIGGTTEWKLSEAAKRLIYIAKLRAFHVHVGRVNSRRRIKWCFDQRVNSIDGTSMSRFSETYLPRFLAYVAGLKHQQCLPIATQSFLYPTSPLVPVPRTKDIST